MKFTQMQLGWIIGLLEGEGSFVVQTLAKPKSVRISVVMTDLDTLQKLKEVAGGSIYGPMKRRPHHKNAWVWHLRSQPAYDLAKFIMPHMSARRRQQIQKMLQAFEKLKAKRHEQGLSRQKRNLKILEFKGEGMTHQQIAISLGLERSTVSKLLKQLMVVVA